VEFEGRDLVKIKSDEDWRAIRGAKISTVFQDPMTSLNPLRRIGAQIVEVIEKHQRLPPREAKGIALELMRKVGLREPEKRFADYPFQYSGGMRQRIVIAIALACRPRILICDEPTTALDVTIQAQILDLIRDLQKEYGFSTIYITHDLGVVANVADRVMVMYAGQIVEYGAVREIFYDPRHPYTWALLSSLPLLASRGERLFAIPGTPPTLFNEIKGDAFAPRNRYALAIDSEEEPPFFEVSPTHFAKTWLLDPRSPAVEPPESIRAMRGRAGAAKGGPDGR
jgi:oligopeptide transport system ATP-binding protein